MSAASLTGLRIAALLRGDTTVELPREADELGWERLYAAATAQGVAGVVHEAAVAQETEMPASVDARFNDFRVRTAAANALILQHVERLAAVFSEHGIDLMFLKGAALLLRCYDDPGLRPMCDIDVLIHPADAARADRLLHRLGYPRGKALLRNDFYPKYHYEAEYLAPGPQPVRLDVHVRPWRPLRYSRIVPDAAFWQSPVRLSLGSASVTVPNGTDMLAHLLCHAAFHGAGRLLWLLDIHRFALTRADSIDWRCLVEQLTRWRLAHAARFAFDHVEHRIGPIVPTDARVAFASAGSSWPDRCVLRQSPNDRDHPLRRTIVDLAFTPGLATRLGYLRAVACPDLGHFSRNINDRKPGWLLAARAARVAGVVLGLRNRRNPREMHG